MLTIWCRDPDWGLAALGVESHREPKAVSLESSYFFPIAPSTLQMPAPRLAT
jgi:hypothetical protein